MRLLMAGTLLFSMLVVPALAHSAEGLVTVKSAHSVTATADRLEQALKAKGMTVFARINHTEGAAGVGLELRPTQLVIFGNPRVGTPLMHCGQTMAIDLPQKALVWEDAEGEVWLGYNDPQYLESRHRLQDCDAAVAKVKKALANFAAAATD